jgi:pimeloyl-ACP methyl ester carboxylesterase
MRKVLAFIILAFVAFSCNHPSQPEKRISGEKINYGDNSQAGRYADVNGIKLYYETYGTGEPLIMLHGNGGSIDAFRNQIPFFEKYYQVIAIDSRLQGKSGGSPDKISYDLMASDFCALLDQLNIKSAYVLGWSDGGIDGILMTLNCPDRVKKLAASGANTVPDTTALSQADFDEMKKVVANPKSTPIEKALNQMMIDQPNIAYSELLKIKCPVLIMAGDRDMIKPEHTLKIFQSIPGASLCIFPDSHHGVCQQHPELFNETVLRFFQK